MKQFKQFSFSALSLSLAIPLLVVAPVFAHQGSGDAARTTTTQTSDSTSTASGETETETEAEHVETVGQTNKARQRATAMVAELKQEHAAKHTAAERQKACEVRKDRLAQRFTKMHHGSINIKTRLDAVLTKAIAYQTKQNLTGADITKLVTDAQTAKATAETSQAALKALTPTLDCSDPNVAAQVAAFKAGAQTARNDLKAYRTAIHNLLDALKKAGTGTTGTNSSTQTKSTGAGE